VFLNWLNRGMASDNFGTVFGSNAQTARGVIDGAILNWERVIGNLHRPDNSNEIDLNISMDPSTQSNGAATTIQSVTGCSQPLLGIECWPTAANITIGSGTDGHGAGWFVDPNPSDNSKFEGTVVNAFASYAQPGSPADGKGDLLTAVTHELGHALGIGPDLQLRLWLYSTNTGVTDRSSCGSMGCPGRYYAFVGPSGYSHLMTSFNSTPDGKGQDAGNSTHTAAAGDPAYPIVFQGRSYSGADDLMNPYYNRSERRLIPTSVVNVLHEAYGYDIVRPDLLYNFYMVLNPSTGELYVRGSPGSTSNDSISISVVSHSIIDVTVTLGTPVPGTDIGASLFNFFPVSSVHSIRMDSGGGNNVIDIHDTEAGIPVTVNLGNGNDTVNISRRSGNLDTIQGAVTIHAGMGADTVNIDDQDAGSSQTYTMNANTVQRTNSALISYGPGISVVNINALWPAVVLHAALSIWCLLCLPVGLQASKRH
jgi:hypothetical protein